MRCAASSWSANASDRPPWVAVRTSFCDELTAATFAANPTPVVLAGIVTVAGTVTAGLLLLRSTVSPPLPAGPFRATKQLSVPAPTIVELLQETPLRTLAAGGADEVADCTPSPLRAAVGNPPASTLLVKVTWPVAAPALEGWNCT